MTLHEVTNCKQTMDSWVDMIKSSVIRSNPASVDVAIEQAVRATILSLLIRNNVRGDALEIVHELSYEKQETRNKQ